MHFSSVLDFITFTVLGEDNNCLFMAAVLQGRIINSTLSTFAFVTLKNMNIFATVMSGLVRLVSTAENRVNQLSMLKKRGPQNSFTNTQDEQEESHIQNLERAHPVAKLSLSLFIV